MKLVLDIDENKGFSLIEYLHTLDYVKIESDFDLPQWHKDLLDERLAFVAENPNAKLPMKDVLDELENG